MVTSHQIRKLFYRGQAQAVCNRRLRILYDLHCVDRFFPPVKKGSAKQHLVLDRAGAMVLGLSSFYKLGSLPVHYRHHVLVAEFSIHARMKGLGWGKLEHKLAGYKVDIYYPPYKLAVEIDTGSEVHGTLERKAERYNRMTKPRYALFVTDGNPDRIDTFTAGINNHIKCAGCNFKDLDELLQMVVNRIR